MTAAMLAYIVRRAAERIRTDHQCEYCGPRQHGCHICNIKIAGSWTATSNSRHANQPAVATLDLPPV